MGEYEEFLASKAVVVAPAGIANPPELTDSLFVFQRDIVRWALRRGRCAVWAGTGTGKTRMALAWADAVCRHTSGKVLVLTPLAVAEQFIAEASEIGVVAKHVRESSDVGETGIFVSNYERLHKFNPSDFSGVVLDESSILRDFSGKTRNMLVYSFERTPFKLCCSATPAPNDYEELGNHAEFLGIMKRTEMLSMFFVHDGETTQEW